MSTKTTYACDRCNKEFIDRKELKCVSAGVGDYSGSDSWYKSFRQDWCLACLDEFGLPHENAKKIVTEPPLPQPTLDDMIRAFIRNELGAAHD